MNALTEEVLNWNSSESLFQEEEEDSLGMSSDAEVNELFTQLMVKKKKMTITSGHLWKLLTHNILIVS